MKNITIPIDFSSDSINALEHGLGLANKLKANISLIHITHGKDFEKPLFFKDLIDFKGTTEQDYLDLIAYRYQDRVDKSIITHIIEGTTSKEIIEFARRSKSAYIVMGTHGTSGFNSYWVGTNAYKVVLKSPCPTITIRNGYFGRELQKIVVPVDSTKHNRRKLPYGAEIAQLFGAEVHLLGVTQTQLKDIMQKVATWHKQSKDYLEGKKIKVTSQIFSGANITDKTIEYSKLIQADLIVITTEQDETPVSLFLGDNAQKIINYSPIPVLSIRPFY